jgi:protein transport protein SEC61 subunit alpha
MYIGSGMYGPPELLSPMSKMLITAQLTIAGLICVLLDEIVQKGYGYGSGTSLFIAVNICETIVWKALSFQRIDTPHGKLFEGAITSFFHQFFFTSAHRLTALQEAFYRPYGANLTNLVATAAVFCVVVYFQGFRLDLNVKSIRMRGQVGTYPIKLFYTSNMPIILQSALISNVYFFSQALYKRWKNSMLVNMLGQWQEVEFTGKIQNDETNQS